MDRDLLLRQNPVLFHLAEDGAWPSIQRHGLLSTRAIVDLFAPADHVREAILGQVRNGSVTLSDPDLGEVTVRDQGPLKFLAACLTPGTTAQEFLDALNGRVFFWMTEERLQRLLGARRYRDQRQTVLRFDTAEVLQTYADRIELAPLNTGSMHVPTAPQRGADVFVPLADYPYDLWRAKRGSRGDAVVELTIPYSVPDAAALVMQVDRIHAGGVIQTLFRR